MNTLTSSRRDSLLRHLLAWSVVGIGCGWFGAPHLSIVTVIAFGLSGTMIGLIVGIATYPFSRQPVLVVVGASCGAMIGCLSHAYSPKEMGTNLPGLCLMIGGLIGSTAAIWQAPLRLLGVSRYDAA